MKNRTKQGKPGKLLAITAVALAVGALPAIAGSVAGTGCGTEVTQILNNIQLVQQYEQQIQQFAKQG